MKWYSLITIEIRVISKGIRFKGFLYLIKLKKQVLYFENEIIKNRCFIY